MTGVCASAVPSSHLRYGNVYTRREDGTWELSLTVRGRSVPVRFVRGGHAFAAVIPGDSVAEQVITSGISSFL